MDFTTPHAIGERINDDFEQLRFGGGMTTFVLNNSVKMNIAMQASASPKNRYRMEIYTTEPGMQVYTGNWMTGRFTAKRDTAIPNVPPSVSKRSTIRTASTNPDILRWY